MEFVIKGGCLYPAAQPEGGPPLARSKNTLCGGARPILGPGGALALRAVIQADPSGRARQYLLLRPDGTPAAIARPGYSPGEDPASQGWPVSHLPRTDHADLVLQGEACVLEMLNSQNYELRSAAGSCLVQVLHRGLLGGWDLRCKVHLPPEELCGLLVFCLYLDRENEFLTV